MDGGRAARVRDMMARQVDHLVRLVDDLMEVSRLSRGMIELRKERIDLAQAVNDAVAASQPLIADHGHRLTVSLPPRRLPLDADPTRIAQVFTNLLNNAARFTNPGGRIEISAREEDGEAVVSVRDNGIGIASGELRRVFDLFARIDNGVGHAGAGFGIGLALARSLVEMHGGRIEAHSEGPGRGSEFTIHLPLAAASADAATKAAAEPAVPPVSARSVLVVDDNRDVGDSLVMLLELLGMDVRVAYDGPSALESAVGFKPEIVFLDLGMPKMDGYETARRLRQLSNGRDVRLVALTGWAQSDDRRRTREAGFNEHLTKPVDLDLLSEVLARRR